jgi:membrane fusion protein, copper/silver efflux system
MTRSTVALFGILLLGVAGGGYWLGRSLGGATPGGESATESPKVLFYRNPMNPSITSPIPAKDEMGMDYVPVYADEAPGERKVLFYRNPMNPSITSPVPAKDEMGMDYVPVYAEDGAMATVPGTVSIDPTVVQNIGVRTAIAERRRLARQIRTVGRVEYDEQGLARVHLRTEGWIESLAVTETGQPVRRGDKLLTLYSPQIVSTEQEYVLAQRGVASLPADAPSEYVEQSQALMRSSAERLRLLNVPESELRRLKNGGEVRRETTLTAPVSGIVQFIGVREGQFVSAQTEAYRIADLSSVWLIADLYEDEVPWVQPGDRAEIALNGQPGHTISARVDYIYPYLEDKTRTQKVRLRLLNPGLLLKPDMYADVTIFADREVNAVTVPESAIVRSGTRNQVFLVRGPGQFEPRVVKLGVAADGYVQILDGLEAGDPIVVSSNFLIDSESKLREAVAKMVPPSTDSASESPTMPADQPHTDHNATQVKSMPAPADQSQQQ